MVVSILFVSCVVVEFRCVVSSCEFLTKMPEHFNIEGPHGEDEESRGSVNNKMIQACCWVWNQDVKKDVGCKQYKILLVKSA